MFQCKVKRGTGDNERAEHWRNKGTIDKNYNEYLQLMRFEKNLTSNYMNDPADRQALQIIHQGLTLYVSFIESMVQHLHRSASN